MLLDPAARSENQMFVVFAVGGVMLGGASLLAARPEAFATFLAPTGVLTALHLASEGDERHLMMGFLAAVYTAATLITTWRFHLAIRSSFKGCGGGICAAAVPRASVLTAAPAAMLAEARRT